MQPIAAKLQTLEAKGFTVGHIAYVPSEFKNLVLSLKNNGETILPGTLLSKGSVIDLELGSGEGNNTVFVPQLTGKKLDEVISLIEKLFKSWRNYPGWEYHQCYRQTVCLCISTVPRAQSIG
ncbi:MAG: hypothetical protein V8S95_02330 [Odoribacter sp.]